MLVCGVAFRGDNRIAERLRGRRLARRREASGQAPPSAERARILFAIVRLPPPLPDTSRPVARFLTRRRNHYGRACQHLSRNQRERERVESKSVSRAEGSAIQLDRRETVGFSLLPESARRRSLPREDGASGSVRLLRPGGERLQWEADDCQVEPHRLQRRLLGKPALALVSRLVRENVHRSYSYSQTLTRIGSYIAIVSIIAILSFFSIKVPSVFSTDV